MRFFVEISFDGTNFHGWQIQPDKVTVQGTINTLFSKILQEKIHITGCGRTDAGVHAKQFYFHFDCNQKPMDNLVYKLNCVLPDSISVKRLVPVQNDQHSRFDAVKRTYVYHTHFYKNPFRQHYSYHCYYRNLDINRMKETALELKQFTDFSPLSKFNEDNQTTICHIKESELIYNKSEQCMELMISADRFLHNMIRRTMGLLISVGRGKISRNEVHDVMSNSKEFRLNFVAPPEGLFLTGVQYPFINE